MTYLKTKQSILKADVFSGMAALTLLAALSWSNAAQAEIVNIPVPKSVVSTAFNAALSSFEVKLDNYGPKSGTSWLKNSSYIRFPSGTKKPFDIEEQTFKITKWRRFRHYVNDMRTSSIQAGVSGGRIEVSAFFESQGEEIKGKCIRKRFGKWKQCGLNIERDIQLNNAQILMSLKPVAYKGSISYSSPTAEFKTDVKIANRLCQTFGGICGWIENVIKTKMTKSIESNLLAGLNNSKNKKAVAKAVRKASAFKNLIDPAWTITKVKSSGSNFIITVKRPDVINASSVKSLKLLPVQKFKTATCPASLSFKATIKTKHAVKGNFWLKYENGKKSKVGKWSAGKNKTISSTVSRKFKGTKGKIKNGWTVMYLTYKASNGQTITKKSNKAKFKVKCTTSGKSNLSL